MGIRSASYRHSLNEYQEMMENTKDSQWQILSDDVFIIFRNGAGIAPPKIYWNFAGRYLFFIWWWAGREFSWKILYLRGIVEKVLGNCYRELLLGVRSGKLYDFFGRNSREPYDESTDYVGVNSAAYKQCLNEYQEKLTNAKESHWHSFVNRNCINCVDKRKKSEAAMNEWMSTKR